MRNIIIESERERILKLHESFGYKSLMNEAITPESLKEKYVKTDRVSPETFDEIMSVSGNKINFAAWLTKMVAEHIIEAEDVYKYDEYFKIFNDNKQHFPIKDINQIKSSFDLKEFLTMVIKMRERNVKLDDSDLGNSKNYISPNEIQKIENVGLEYMGMVDGYQAFEVPSGLSDKEWKVYQQILGRCAGRDQGAKIDLCTFGSYEHYQGNTKEGPLFVFFNLGDPQSPYQFSYETNQFMDKNNQPLF
jgi:hypothetical protein